MIKSLSEQTYISRTKVIVLDDCSTDDSVEILKRSAEKFKINLTINRNEKNLGVSRTSRKMYWMIKTPFWAVLDPDDYYIDPQRLERAVKFLESHPDHAMHGCNFVREFSDGRRIPAIPESVQNFSSENLTTMPFFQTSAGTFRNFWTENLLLELERIAGQNRVRFEGDSFRNFCAINSGKVYLDNFIGSVYTMEFGIWDSMPAFSKDVLEVVSNYSLFEFARNFFHNEINATFSIRLAFMAYLRVMDEINAMMKDYSALKFQASNYFKDMLDLPNGNFEDVFHLMLDYCRKFEELGIGIVRK